MTAIEVIEQLRPKHFPHLFVNIHDHDKNNCDGCLFDKAISDLIKEAVDRERELCAKSHLRKIIDEILTRNKNI